MGKQLIFSGGKQKQANSQSTTPDNLRSEDAAELLIGISEGPIAGLDEGEKSLYVGSTPLANADGSKNFVDYTLDLKRGDAAEDETVVFYQGGMGRPEQVGQELHQWKPVTRTTVSSELDYIDLRFQISRLMHVSGQTVANAILGILIEWKEHDKSEWVFSYPLSIIGKTQSAYMRDVRIPVSKSAKTTWDIRITKTTPDSPLTDDGIYGDVSWVQYEEIVAARKQFTNTALLHINIKTSDELTSLPDFSGIYKLLMVKVPSNYNPEQKTYNGTWDGTFKIAWTDNPAWCLYDYLTNDRYGVASYYPIVCDKWDFYEASKYCDEKVPDGVGGTEARYTFNGIITDGMSGREMIDYMAGVFNATIYEDAMGVVHLALQDNKQAVHIFSEENVTAEGFTYSFADPANRYNDYKVTFTNPALNWDTDTRRIYDQNDIELNGRISLDFDAVGCIKESEALRRARYKLICGLTEVMSVSFKTTRVAYNVNVFDTILIADENMGYSTHGRIKSVSSDRLTLYLRDSIFIEAGVQYKIKLQTPSGISEIELETNEVGDVNELTLTQPAPLDLPEYAVFSLSGVGSGYGEAKPFRVISIAENTDNPDLLTINAIEINRNKQFEADTGIELSDLDYSIQPSIDDIPHVKGAEINSTYVKKIKGTYTQVTMDLDYVHYPFYSGEFRFFSRPVVGENPAWQEYQVQFGDTIVNHPGGAYDIVVLPKNNLGKTPSFDTAPIFRGEIYDLTRPPADVSNFRAETTLTTITLKWDAVKDDDLIGYEIREGNDWNTATQVVSFITGESYTMTLVDANEHSYMIKAIDVLRNESVNPAYLSTSVALPYDITEFYVTPNYDTIRFDWVSKNSDSNVEYEVRMGNSWDTGTTLFKVKGNNQSILNPANTTSGFYIRAISSIGKYSANARYASLTIELAQNRNVIMDIDNAKAGWIGVTSGLEESEHANILAMKPGVFYAEHYFPVHLPEVIRARNWYETEFFKYGDKMKWEDMDWSWDSEEAKQQTWLSSSVVQEGEGRIQPVISYEKTEAYSELLGLRFDDTLDDINGDTTPSYQQRVSYGGARYLDGLVLNRIVSVGYSAVALPEQFTLRFRLKLTAGSVSDFQILRVENSVSGAWINLRVSDDILICEDNAGGRLDIAIERINSTDFCSFMLTQNGEERILDFSAEYANIKKRTSSELTPLGTFDKLYIGVKND